MTGDMSYTTEEISKLLKISKLTVYDLIKKGELSAYRVGKQMRIDAADLEAYKRKAKQSSAAGHSVVETGSAVIPASHPAAAASTNGTMSQDRTASAAGSTRQLVITGQDTSLDLLAAAIGRRISAVRPLRSFAGSLDSLVAMYNGQADIVSTHLLDGDTGEYNVSYIRKLLVGLPYIVVNLVSRSAGLYVAPNNPKRLAAWSDLGRAGLRVANRERGSGARVLLDEQLRLHGLLPSLIEGYANELTSHIAVAGKVASGEADFGVGIEKAARLVNVEFVPLITERYDLVMLNTAANAEWLADVLAIIRSDTFKNELSAIHGYDLSRTGEIMYEPAY